MRLVLPAAAGSGNERFGGLEEPPGSSRLEFLHQEPSAIPQLHPCLGQGLRVPPPRRECLHWAKSAFSLSVLFLEMLGRGREEPPLQQEALSPSSSQPGPPQLHLN